LVITCDLDDKQKEVIKELQLLTNKPFVYGINVSEDQLELSQNELRKLI
jgi:ribosome-binding ATPase YchF (GTP1/OBG family)